LVGGLAWAIPVEIPVPATSPVTTAINSIRRCNIVSILSVAEDWQKGLTRPDWRIHFVRMI
jgi:hypothetical protein